ncbi:hypothetical protein GOP47_0015255 [Adiantum capillus-veneris]|uniref:RING-type E3 ubiquitin transferase n=1 Tax=Adiantum capillus-veneris TaxID=13818 RepID=A0A9D4UK31_ADICA|nr:hypothetical protein GOP47_0015255 [Adiantum capillus-veneris]
MTGIMQQQPSWSPSVRLQRRRRSSTRGYEASFAPKIPPLGIVGRVYAAEPLNACQPVKSMNSNDIPGFLLLERGDCNFVTKIKHAQDAGYVAAIVYNDEDNDDLITMSGRETGIDIYAVFVTKKAGEILHLSVAETDSRCYLFPMFENAAKSFVAILFLSFLTVFAIFSTLFFVRRHHYHRASAGAQARGMAWKDVKALTIVLYGSDIKEFSTCAICLEDYRQGERLRILPCGHEFHETCIDQWLTTQRCFCPICKTDAHSKLSRKVPSEQTPLLASYVRNINTFASVEEASAADKQFAPIEAVLGMPESAATSITPCSCSPASRMLASDAQDVAISVKSD